MTNKSLFPELPTKVFDWVQRTLPYKQPVQDVELLKGATSTTLYKITTISDVYVLRLYDNEDWLMDEPDLARHEAASLEKAATTNKDSLQTPRFINIDESGEKCGVPAILMSFVPGKVNLTPKNLTQWLKELARTLVMIHQIVAELTTVVA